MNREYNYQLKCSTLICYPSITVPLDLLTASFALLGFSNSTIASPVDLSYLSHKILQFLRFP